MHGKPAIISLKLLQNGAFCYQACQLVENQLKSNFQKYAAGSGEILTFMVSIALTELSEFLNTVSLNNPLNLIRQ